MKSILKLLVVFLMILLLLSPLLAYLYENITSPLTILDDTLELGTELVIGLLATACFAIVILALIKFVKFIYRPIHQRREAYRKYRLKQYRRAKQKEEEYKKTHPYISIEELKDILRKL